VDAIVHSMMSDLRSTSALHPSAICSTCAHTSVYKGIRRHTSAYVSVCIARVRYLVCGANAQIVSTSTN